nr:hypothetical protein [uncultured Moellerella sp.]
METIKEAIKDITREEFKEILNDTIFKGKNTKNMIERLSELYDPKKGNVSKSDLVLYRLIDFSQQDKFLEKIKLDISDLDIVGNHIENMIINGPVNTELLSAVKYITIYYDRLRYFLNNITNGLADTIVKIECDSINFGYSEGVLDEDDLKENIIKLNSELKPLRSSLSTQIFNLNKRLIKLNGEARFADFEYIEELEKINDDIMDKYNKESVDLIKSMTKKVNIAVIDVPSVFSDESNINILTNSMTDCKYDKSMGSSLTSLNNIGDYVQCDMFTTVGNIARIK